MTSKAEIKEWAESGVANNKTHMIIVCDTYDWEDYPVYVDAGQDAHNVYNTYNGPNMQRVMEVYDLRKPMQPQLDISRAFNF